MFDFTKYICYYLKSCSFCSPSQEFKLNRNALIEIVRDVLSDYECIVAAKVYGSWLYNEQSVDVDIALLVQSLDGVVLEIDYRTLKKLRRILGQATKCDIDLVPHTYDELELLTSPLWYPRYNPSLIFGSDIKGEFPVKSITSKKKKFTFADLTMYVLLDNRTICRRQLIRSLTVQEARIFVSKLLHGPGNALTYHACVNHVPYEIPPSDITGCFHLFDDIYKVDSAPALSFLNQCKKGINFTQALQLMRWYEHLVVLVLKGERHMNSYQFVCMELGKM